MKNEPKRQMIEVTLEKSETITIRRHRTIATVQGHDDRGDAGMPRSDDANAPGRDGDLDHASGEEIDQ